MSAYESEPLELFLYAMKSDATKDRYKKRLGNFFDFQELIDEKNRKRKQFKKMLNKSIVVY